MIFTMKRGDTSPNLKAGLFAKDLNLTGATVVFSMRAEDNSKPVYRKPMQIISAVQPVIVGYDWQAGDTDIIGLYRVEYRVTFANGDFETFPNAGYNYVSISENI